MFILLNILSCTHASQSSSYSSVQFCPDREPFGTRSVSWAQNNWGKYWICTCSSLEESILHLYFSCNILKWSVSWELPGVKSGIYCRVFFQACVGRVILDFLSRRCFVIYIKPLGNIYKSFYGRLFKSCMLLWIRYILSLYHKLYYSGSWRVAIEPTVQIGMCLRVFQH